MNWFQILQSIVGTEHWRRRMELHTRLNYLKQSAEEACACMERDEMGVFSFRQCSEALKELESHFAELQKLKSELQ
jgi:hypothetical protein